MSASEKIQRNKKVGFQDVLEGSPREGRSRSRGRARDRRAKSMDVRAVDKDGSVPRKRDRSLIGLVRQGSRKSVSSLVKLFEAGKSFYMTEGRKCQIVLPDDRRLDMLVQPKLNTSELLDMVASHFKLKEKEYFGLAFQDETGHFNWLQLDKKVLEHDLPRKQGTILFIYFLVRFFVESITQLRDTATVELFYLNAKQAVFKGQIQCDSETVFELAAHVLQATVGDFVDDATTKAELKKLPLITTSALTEHPSIQYCEEKVIHYYKNLAGTGKGLAIVNYMTILERLPTYGIHYFEVKDKKDIPWWLGISNKGIGVYDKNDKNLPRRVFVWKSLENLYYRDKKFSIEVHDPKRVSVSRRTFGPGNVNVHAWFGATPQLTKCIWCMAVAQHQFYHERKHSRASLPSVRSVSELATELSRSTSSLPGSIGSDISRSGSSASLPSLGASRFDLNFDPADTAKVQREMYQALKARREGLEEILQKKTEELKMLCIKEGELTGRLPVETPLLPGEEPPQIRRRVGTAFSLSANVVQDKNEDDVTKKLELELELQKQITSAAHKLASDKSVSKYVRKQRRHSFIKAQSKMKEMEKKLNEMRKGGGAPGSPLSTGKHDDSEVQSPAQSPLVPRGPRSNYKQHDGRPGHHESPLHRSNTAPKTFHGEREIASATLPNANSSLSLETGSGYKPNAVYSTQYRNQNYPTLSNRSQSNLSNHSDYDNSKTGSQIHLEGSQDSGFSSTNNMYNVNSRRTSRYESNQDLVSPGEPHYETLDHVLEKQRQLNKGTLDSGFRKNQHNYGSLERNLSRRSNREYTRKLSDTDAINESNSNSPSKFGKRTSRSEYDLSSASRDPEFQSTSDKKFEYTVTTPSRSESRTSNWSEATPNARLIELPVKHESVSTQNYPGDRSDFYSNSQSGWQDAVSTEPSPIIQSPTKRNFSDPYGSGGGEPSIGQCYSPREYEGSRYHSKPPPYSEHSVNVKHVDTAHLAPQAISSKIVTIAKQSPHLEMSKPFEMKDYYKYSERLRRQRLVEQYHQVLVGSRASTPSQHSSDGENHSVSSRGPSHSSSSHYGQGLSNQGSGMYRGGSTSSPFGSPLSSRHMTANSPFPSHSQGETTGYTSSRTNINTMTPGSYGVSTTTSRVQYTVQSQTGRVMYKAQHQSSKQTHYQPPTSMKCEAVRSVKDVENMRGRSHEAPASSRTTPKSNNHHRQYSTPERNMNTSMNISFHLSPPGSLSGAFSNEMLEWYDGEGKTSPTSV